MNEVVYISNPPVPVPLHAGDRIGEPGGHARPRKVRCVLCGGRAEYLYRNPDVCDGVPLCPACHGKARAAWSRPWARINDRLSLASFGYYWNRKRAKGT